MTPIKIVHLRQETSQRGGMTLAYDSEHKKIAYAVCSKEDMYSRKRGKSIATGRLLKRGIEENDPTAVINILQKEAESHRLHIDGYKICSIIWYFYSGRKNEYESITSS